MRHQRPDPPFSMERAAVAFVRGVTVPLTLPLDSLVGGLAACPIPSLFAGGRGIQTTLLRPGKRPGAMISAPFCAAWLAPFAPSGRGSRSCCAPILTTPARKSLTGAETTRRLGAGA